MLERLEEVRGRIQQATTSVEASAGRASRRHPSNAAGHLPNEVPALVLRPHAEIQREQRNHRRADLLERRGDLEVFEADGRIAARHSAILRRRR